MDDYELNFRQAVIDKIESRTGVLESLHYENMSTKDMCQLMISMYTFTTQFEAIEDLYQIYIQYYHVNK